MGTPVPMKKREMDVKSVTGPVIERKMTEEEKQKYNNLGQSSKPVFVRTEFIQKQIIKERDDTEMAKRKERPDNETLIKLCEGFSSVYQASKALVDELGVTRTTIARWIQEAGIVFQKDIGAPAPVVEIEKKEISSVVKDGADTKEFENVSNQQVNQELDNTTSLIAKLNYTNYRVGSILVEIDFQKELVCVGESKEFSFEEAKVACELLLEII